MFTWLNDLARWIFDKQLTSIEVCDGHLEATQSLNQADALDNVKVVGIAAEFLILIEFKGLLSFHFNIYIE